MLVIILVCSAVASGNLILGPGVASTSTSSQGRVSCFPSRAPARIKSYLCASYRGVAFGLVSNQIGFWPSSLGVNSYR